MAIASAVMSVLLWWEEFILTQIDGLLHPCELQVWVAHLIILIILFNLVLIMWAWNKYGRLISERFMVPATNRSLEEFKKEAALLKLPLQHSPRI